MACWLGSHVNANFCYIPELMCGKSSNERGRHSRDFGELQCQIRHVRTGGLGLSLLGYQTPGFEKNQSMRYPIIAIPSRFLPDVHRKALLYVSNVVGASPDP